MNGFKHRHSKNFPWRSQFRSNKQIQQKVILSMHVPPLPSNYYRVVFCRPPSSIISSMKWIEDSPFTFLDFRERCGKDRSEVSQPVANTCLWHGIIFFFLFYFRVPCQPAIQQHIMRRRRRWNRKWGSHGMDKGSHLRLVLSSSVCAFGRKKVHHINACVSCAQWMGLNSNLERLSLELGLEQDRGNRCEARDPFSGSSWTRVPG